MNSTATYAFILSAKTDWRKASEDDWDWETIELSGLEKTLGHRQFDGVTFRVLQLSDKEIVAIHK